jgi:hypothetical protein
VPPVDPVSGVWFLLRGLPGPGWRGGVALRVVVQYSLPGLALPGQPHPVGPLDLDNDPILDNHRHMTVLQPLERLLDPIQDLGPAPTLRASETRESSGRMIEHDGRL